MVGLGYGDELRPHRSARVISQTSIVSACEFKIFLIPQSTYRGVATEPQGIQVAARWTCGRGVLLLRAGSQMSDIERTIAVEEIRLWRLAVETQHRRILTDFHALDDLLAANVATADLRLYAVALRNLLRAVKFAIVAFPEHSSPLRQAEHRFSGNVPDASVIRDILEHFDDYAKGSGKLIKEGDMNLPPVTSFHFASASTKVSISLYRSSDEDGDFVIARSM